MMKRRHALRRLGALSLSLGGAELSWGAGIVSVRVWPAKEYTRVTLESDVGLVASHFLADNPSRLVVNIQGLELSPTLRDLVGKVKADDPFIAGIRVGQYQPKVIRLVIDLKQAVKPQQFALAPVAAYQHRLVFDLYPTEAVDPLLALIQDKLRAEQQADQAVGDALGELIGQVDRPLIPAPPAAPSPVAVPGANPSGQPAPEQMPTPPAAAPASAPSLQTHAPTRPPTPAQRERFNRLIIVALDPGHGGEDPGAIGPTGLREKDVVLRIAEQLRERIDAQPGMRALMTRDDDFFVPLNERVSKARKVQADLFVSIHADAFQNREARGASVFALSASGASSATARWMAQRENAADVVGGVNLKTQDAQVLKTLLDMSTTAQIKDSLRVAQEVLHRIGTVGRLHKGQVEQAGFAVLKAPEIPSILVETAFISNPEEEAKLRSSAFQKHLVEAIFQGLTRYFARNPPLIRSRQIG